MPPIKPDFVIGVDFGMTQTGVAFAKSPWNASTPVKSFQHWRPRVSQIANKVPTRIGYSSTDGSVRSWGFGCDFGDGSVSIKEFFKLALDPGYRDPFVSFEEARSYFRDYLKSVRLHIVKDFQAKFPNWEHLRIDWVFSVPTTWKNPALMPSLLELIRSAGFGTDGLRHTCHITLSEAEAAAVFVAHGQLRKDDVVLVCDAGGGTTDINILKVASNAEEPRRLRPLLKVEGRAIGSALIDIKVQRIIADRLRHIADRLPASPEEVAERMMYEKFEDFKCNMGSGDFGQRTLRLDIHGLPQGFDQPAMAIQDSQVVISRDQVREIFDEQVNKLITLVDEQASVLSGKEPGESIAYLILSGGFGSSTYLQDCLKAHFTRGHGARLHNVSSMQVLTAEDPQLSVVHGLVLERVQELAEDKSSFEHRCARASYGIVVRQVYREQYHSGEKVVRDELDGKRWADNQVEWLIRQGDKFSQNGVSQAFQSKIRPEDRRRAWTAQFVRCMRKDELPRNMHDPDIKPVCSVSVALDKVQMTAKNDNWWNTKRRYYEAAIEVRLIPGSADLKFELVSNGQVVNLNDAVEVAWDLPMPHDQW